MNAKHAALALALAGASSGTMMTVFAQAPGVAPAVGQGGPSPVGPGSGNNGVAGAIARDPKVFPASASLPTPAVPDPNMRSNLALPDGPVEPFLLTKDAGPFLVIAKTFRGPDAERSGLHSCSSCGMSTTSPHTSCGPRTTRTAA